MFELAWPWVRQAQASFEMMRNWRSATGNGSCDCPYFAEMLLSSMTLLGVGMREEQTNRTVLLLAAVSHAKARSCSNLQGAV